MVCRALTCTHTSVCICSTAVSACLAWQNYTYVGNRIDCLDGSKGKITERILVHIGGLTPHLATKCCLSLREVFLYPSWGSSRSPALRLKDASVRVDKAVQASTERTTFLCQTRQEQNEDSRCAFVPYFIWPFAVSLWFPFHCFSECKTQVFREKTRLDSGHCVFVPHCWWRALWLCFLFVF